MKLQNVVADLHTHGWAGQEEGRGQGFLRWCGETGQRNLATIYSHAFLHGQNTLVGMVNFGDTRYEKIVNTRGQIGNGIEIHDDDKKRFVGVHDTHNRWVFVLRGQEIPTDKGHVLILGGDRNIPKQYGKLNDVLNYARDMEAMTVADHPTAEKGIFGEVFSYLTHNGKSLSLNELDLETHHDQFNLIEPGNSNFPEIMERVVKIAERLGINQISSSDSHKLRHLFKGYTVFPELDFETWERLRRGLMVQGEMHFGKNGKYEKFLHGVSVLYNIGRQKLGIVKMPEIEIQ